MNKKLLAALLASTLSLSLFASCGDKGGKDVASGELSDELSPEDSASISIYHIYNEEIAESFVDGAAMMYALDEFKKDYPNVEVEEIIVPDDWTQKLLTYSASGDMPDVYQEVTGTVLNTLVKNGSALPLDDVFSEEYLSKYLQDCLDTFRVDDKLYGVTLYTEVGSTVVYNKALWEEAGYSSFPETWDEIITANDYFQSKGISTFALGDQAQWIFRQCYFVTICNEFMGSEWFDQIGTKNPEAGYNNPEFINALTRAKSLGSLFNADWKSIIDTEATNQYLDGKAAASINGNWIVSQVLYSESDYPDVVANTGIAMFPGETGALTQVSGGVGCGLSLSGDLAGQEGTAHYNAAVKLAEYVAGEPYNVYTKEHGMGPSMDVEANTGSLPALSKEYLNMCDAVTYIPPFDRHGIDGQLDTVLSSVLQDVASGNMTPEDGAKLMQETYESLM